MQSATAFEGGIKTYKDSTETTTFDYGDIITVKATPKATGTAPQTLALTPPTANQMALFIGETQITAPQAATSGQELTFSVDTKNTALKIGENTITANYVGGANSTDCIGTVTVTLNEKVITSTTALDFTTGDHSTATLEDNGYTWTGDETNGYTLTLGNLNLTVEKGNAITLPEADVSIVLNGTTNLNAEGMGIDCTGTEEADGKHTVTISGDGSLSTTSKNGNGIDIAQNLTVKGGTLDLKGRNGIVSFGDIEITGGTITGNGIMAMKALTISSGTVNVSTEQAALSAIQVMLNITISGGSVTAISASANNYGIYAGTAVDISGGSVTAKGGKTAIQGETGITFSIGMGITSPDGAVIGDSDGAKVILLNGEAVKDVTIGKVITPTLTVDNITKTYDGTAVTSVTGTAKVDSTIVPGTFAFDAATPELKKAGTYTVTVKFTPTSLTDYTEASTDITVTINKAAATVKADDKSIVFGAAKPDYTATTTGLVNGETISGVTFTDNAADTNTKGSFTITPSGGTISGGGNDNYILTYENGVLIVNIDVSVIDTAIDKANTQKANISINDKAASQVSKGTKFVTTEEMAALNTAIQTATDAKATVNTSAEAQEAAAALDKAVETFKAAIKTGTHTSGGGSTGGGGSSSGGSSSGGSSSGGSTTTTKPDVNKPTAPTTTVTEVKPIVDKNGIATVSITDNTVDSAIKKAQEEAKKNGTTANGIAVEINATTKQTINSLTVTLPKSVQEKLIAAGVKNVTIKSGAVDISIDLKALKQMKSTTNSDVNVTATKVDNSKLSAEAKKAVGNRPIFDFNVTGTNGKTVSDFGKGSISISIPYTLAKGEKAGNVVAVYINDAGKVEYLTSSSYNANTGKLLFATNHFSTYGVAYKADTTATTFSDITNHWAKESIEFVTARGLFAGTGNGKFNPNASMTRGMFVTALGRLAGANVSSYKQSRFTDVKAGSYYMGYVEWANKNGIVKGTSTITFAPDQSITREQMAVIIANYAKAIGFDMPTVYTAVTFADNAKISSYAKGSVKQMQMAGILMGKDGNRFDPQGTATRAEVSAMLKRFVELAVSSDTADGWHLNDSGKWLYFENGKAVTGKKNIDGKTYEFNQYGIVAEAPKRSYVGYTVQKGDSFWSIAHKYHCSMVELAKMNDKTIFSIIKPGDVLKVPGSK